MDNRITIPADSIIGSQPRDYKDYWLIVLRVYKGIPYFTVTETELGDYLYYNKELGYKNMATIVHNKIVLVNDECNFVKYTYDETKFLIKTKGLIFDSGFKDKSYWEFKLDETKSYFIGKGF